MKLLILDWSDPSAIHKVTEAEAALYSSTFVFDLDWEDKVLKIVNTRAELKKQFEDSMKLVYELLNERARSK